MGGPGLIIYLFLSLYDNFRGIFKFKLKSLKIKTHPLNKKKTVF